MKKLQCPSLKLCFNPRSPRGGATGHTLDELISKYVSIHAPHEGERRRIFVLPFYRHLLFQSTLPTRGSDEYFVRYIAKIVCFNPRSPRGGATRSIMDGLWSGLRVSIHAPHEGERRRKSAFVCSISANLLNIIHCGTVTRAVSRRRIALFRLFSVRRSGVFMYAYASH